jgi:dolichol-phosphate mannosyltransferase
MFVVVDRASRDGTQQSLEEMRDPAVRVVWAPENRNVVDEYVRGYRAALDAGSDWILEIDAGYSHQPRDIPQFIEHMQQGYDCVFGSRFVRGAGMKSTARRYFLSRGGTVLSNALLGTRLRDMTSGFEMFSRDVLARVVERGIRSKGHFFQTEIRAYCRELNVVEVPIEYRAPSRSVNNAVLADAFLNLARLVGERVRGKLSLTPE